MVTRRHSNKMQTNCMYFIMNKFEYVRGFLYGSVPVQMEGSPCILGSLYNEVQCIKRNGRTGPPSEQNDIQMNMKILPSNNFTGGQ